MIVMFGEKKEKQEPRFKKIYSDNLGVNEIWIDRETGVNYLWHTGIYAGSITPLLGSDGQPIITPVVKEN
jgi:hypothetical protein